MSTPTEATVAELSGAAGMQDAVDAALTVAVVIPTVGRPALRAAVLSALRQQPAPREVIVAVDRPRPADTAVAAQRAELVGVDDERLRVIWTGGDGGPAGTRLAGVREATSEIIAFLDDDDEWLPGNLAARLAVYRRAATCVRHPVVACRADVVDQDGESHGVQPREVYRSDRPLADYLFARRSVRGLGFVLGASTLLCGRELLVETPFDVDLPVHEDWDWLLRVTARPDCRLEMIAAAAVRYRLSPAHASASRQAGGWWRGVQLVDRWGLTGQVRADFLLGIPAGMAIECGDRPAAVRIARLAARSRPGRVAWAAFALQLLVPVKLIAAAGLQVSRVKALIGRGRRPRR